MKLEVGKQYVDKAGHVWEVLTTTRPGTDRPVVLMNSRTGIIGTRRLDGRLNDGLSRFDLVKEYREPRVIYVNEYASTEHQQRVTFINEGYVYTTQETAINNAGINTVRKAVKYIEVLED